LLPKLASLGSMGSLLVLAAKDLLRGTLIETFGPGAGIFVDGRLMV
jgi:hypothetical protein